VASNQSGSDGVCRNVSELFNDGLRRSKLDDRGLSAIPHFAFPLSKHFHAQRDRSVQFRQKSRQASSHVGHYEVLVGRHERYSMHENTMPTGDNSKQVEVELVHLLVGTE
jgi:hypothetical protein